MQGSGFKPQPPQKKKNQNQNFIKKNTVLNFQTLTQYKERKDRHVSARFFVSWYIGDKYFSFEKI